MAEIAVIKTGGKQYKVEEGKKIKIEKLDTQEKNITFDDILNGQKVTAKIIGEGKDKKVEVLKFRAKKRYKRVVGHRQHYMEIQIESIK